MEDASALIEAVRSSMDELSVWLPWATESYGLDEASGWIAGVHGDRFRLLLLEPDGTVVGGVGINDVDDHHRRANLGYWVRSDRTGRGYATEAVRRMVEIGFGEAGMLRLEVLMSVENVPSRRVAEKAGAQHEGVARARLRVGNHQHDAHVFSFVRGDAP